MSRPDPDPLSGQQTRQRAAARPAEVTRVDESELPGLLDRLVDPHRELPVVLVSPAYLTGLPRIDVDDLASAVAELGVVVQFTSRQTAEQWREITPPDLHAYDGTIRVVPAPTSTQRPRFYVTSRRDDPADTIARVTARLQAHRTATEPAADVSVAPRLSEGTQTPRVQAALPPSTAEQASTDQTLSAQMTGLRAELDDVAAQLEELFAELVDVTDDRDRWKGLALSRQVFDDPEEQFRWEVHTEWSSWPDADRQQYPLADYKLGPDWLFTLGTLQGVAHDRIIEVTAQVLAGRAWNINAREVHQLRSGQGGDDPPLRRSSDNATAWRCSLQNNTPAARRLLWWQLHDGIELGRVAVHDDYYLR